MITRKPSKIVDSLVNSSHEDHLNVVNAIKDEAPITDLTSVVKSVNFELDGDGAYILRKPLVFKDSLMSGTRTRLNRKIYLLEPYDRMEITKTTLPGNRSTMLRIKNVGTGEYYKLMLRFYDNEMGFHEVLYEEDDSDPENIIPPTIGNSGWISNILNDNVRTNELILGKIQFYQSNFLNSVDKENNAVLEDPSDPDSNIESWHWTLISDRWDAGDQSWENDILLKRFIKIYKHESEEDTYVIEIIRPELNSITSSLDVGNSATLDVNLLLDNPYAIRDLYGYGYVSCTKIVPYVTLDDDSSYDRDSFAYSSVWELTECLPDYENEAGYGILISGNPFNFERRFVILKAFITTTITNANYYCCWEFSKDDGATWEECPEFINQWDNSLVNKQVSDITYAEFDKSTKEDLEQPANYLVYKKLLLLDRLKLDYVDDETYVQNYSIEDALENRPDVLILDRPNLTYLYRFQIYVDTNATPPAAKEVTKKYIFNNFYNYSSSSTNYVEAHSSDNKISVVAIGGGIDSPTASDGKLDLFGNNYFPDTKNPRQLVMGNLLNVSIINPQTTTDTEILSVKINTYPTMSNTTWNYYATVFGVKGYDRSDIGKDWLNKLSNPNATCYLPEDCDFGMVWKLTKPHPVTHAPSKWVPQIATEDVIKAGQSKTYNVASYSNDKLGILLTVLTNYLSVSSIENITGEDVDPADLDSGVIAFTCIESIEVEYKTTEIVNFTSIYLCSSTGAFKLPYSKTMVIAPSLQKEHDALFEGKTFFYENQKQLMVYEKTHLYVSGTNSAVMKLMNSIDVPEVITKIIPWRGYLLIFCPRNIYLARYDIESDTYTLKILSTTVGVSEKDAETVVPILNSIYFKSKDKIYKLVPNLYSASDDILNVHQISTGVNKILTSIFTKYEEGFNCSYADADNYTVFIPIDATPAKTIAINYDFNKKLWTMQEYPVLVSSVEKYSLDEVYLYAVENSYNGKIFYFRESMDKIIAQGIRDFIRLNDDYDDYDLDPEMILRTIPYADYLTQDPYLLVYNVVANPDYEDVYASEYISNPIEFEIDFGQKSSNYTLDKQFLESKLLLATLSTKDTFPLTLDIYTDGVSRELHWDANTDAALWRKDQSEVGILNTNFSINGKDCNGIFRQLIVKYSGRGKTIRHIISGKSRTLFKFYSMNVRGRILPKKH